MERTQGFYPVKIDGYWTVAMYYAARPDRPGYWSTSDGVMRIEEFEDVGAQRIPMPDDEPDPQAAAVKCVDCKWGEFQRTDSGRVKKKVAGRCQAVVDVELPVLLCSDAPKAFFKQGIWPDTVGRCDFFTAL